MSKFDHILHRADGVNTVELNSQVGTFRAVTSEKLTAVRQDVWSAELTLVTSEAFIVNVGDWIEAKGMRLYCMSTIDRYTCSEDNNREYQLTFYDPIYYLRQAVFYNTSESVSEGVYSYSRVDNAYPSVGTFEDFAKLCCYNCNSVQGVRMFKVGTVSESIATDIRVLTFSDYNCLAVLKQSCEEFETTWRVRINKDPDPDSLFIIDFGVEIEDFPVTLQVEKSQGLMSIEVTASDKDVFTQFVVKGGTDNLPSDYPYTNLQLDEDLEGTPPVYANSMIKKPELYARWGKSVKELVNENIKPSRTGTVTAIDENILKFFDSDLIGADWSPVGGTVHFVKGHLIGFTFNVQDYSETGEITIESTEENNGFVLPSPADSYYRINEGDKYNIAGVSLPASYVTAAKEELKEWSIAKIDGYWSQPRMQAAVKIDPSIISVEVVPNMGLPIIHEALAINKIIKVQQVVYDLSKDSPYDIEDIIISDLKTDDSKADTTHRQIATTRSIVNGTGAGNVYEAKMISRQRILDDYAKSQNLPNWATFMEILSSGKGLWKDEDGEWWLNVSAIKAGAISATMINVNDLIVKCLLTDVDDQGFRFDIRTVGDGGEQISRFMLYDPDSSVKAKIEMQGSGSEVYMNIENEEIGTSTDKDGFHVNDIDVYGNKTERVKLAKGEMSLSNENTGKEMFIGTDKIVFKQTAAGETTELATLNIELIPRMIFASDWSGMTESQKKAIPLAYIYDPNNAITNIYRYGGYPIPGTNVTLYASGVTSTDSRWTNMNNALGNTPSIFAYCNKYNEEPRLYLAFDVSTLPSNATITQFTIECKVRGEEGFAVTNKLWGGILLNSAEQWDWDISNNDSIQTRYMSRSGSFTKAQLIAMRALFRSDLNGNSALNRAVRVYYAKLSLTYVTP